jgi:hypothetical protein
MKFWAVVALTASLASASIVGQAVGAGDNAIDCGSTPFVFSGNGYLVTCQRYELPAQKHGENGQSQSDVINVTSEEPSMSLTMLSIRLISTGLHMRHESLRENTRAFFGAIDAENWADKGAKAGYDTAEFTSDIDGQLRHCVAVQRYLDPAHGGSMRHVIGMGCAAGSPDSVYAALKQMQAPGD